MLVLDVPKAYGGSYRASRMLAQTTLKIQGSKNLPSALNGPDLRKREVLCRGIKGPAKKSGRLRLIEEIVVTSGAAL